jgi:hypothetical protein
LLKGRYTQMAGDFVLVWTVIFCLDLYFLSCNIFEKAENDSRYDSKIKKIWITRLLLVVVD